MGVAGMTRPASARKKVADVVDRMRLFFSCPGMKFASREMVEKWAREIEVALGKEEE